jgi:PAS domain S-box-containing protein
VVTADAKLALVEFLLATDDLSSCAQHGVEWLGTTAGVQRALVAAGAVDPRRLWGVAGLGISSARTGEFSLDLEDGTHPLVSVVRGTRAVHFPVGSRQPETPLESVPFYAIPLRADQADQNDRRSIGLLLVAMEQAELDPDLLWFAEVLGEKLSRLRARGAGADRGLDRERKLLYSIINAVTDPILLTDAGGKLIIGNRHAEELFAAREEESEGRRRAVALNNMFFSSALASAAMDRTRTWGVAARELVLVNPEDGSDLLFELLSSPVRELTEGTALVSVLRNVTDLGQARRELEDNYRKLRLAEAAVRAERNRLDLIVDSVVDPIIVSDPGGDILMTNVPAEKFFTIDTAAGPDAQMRVSANAAHLSSFVSSLLLSGRDDRWRGRISLVDPTSARHVPVEAVAAKMLSDQSELTAVVTVLHDQTEAIEKEKLYGEVKRGAEELEAKVRAATAELAHQNELLRRQALALEQASTAKSQFLANISHEFRTPLNAMLGYTSMLMGGTYGSLDDTQRRVLSRVDANSRHLLVLISDILDISRIEAGRMPVQFSSFRIDDVVSAVTEEMEAVIARSPVAVTFVLAPRVPAIRSDQQKVKQILVNLLSNALKFTHDGSIQVTTGFDRRSGRITIEVRDSGIGIAPADQQRIFEDFQQVDSSTTKSYSGTGLGLSICRRFADMLGGRIVVKSELGVGSTFTLSLPSRARTQARRGGSASGDEGSEETAGAGEPDAGLTQVERVTAEADALGEPSVA